MNENLKDYFYFSKTEKNGIIILLIILLLLISLPYFYDFFSKEESKSDPIFANEIELFKSSLKETEEPEYKNRLDQYIIERYDSIKLFFFNPNSTSPENFIKLGLTDKQVKTISNYLDKGGQFYIKDDFRKIYGIRYQQYQILKPYILLPENKTKQEFALNNSENISQKEDKIVSYFVFDPNTASDEDFKKLGLSETNIKTIRNYQKKIGKFNSRDDFKKIYGISEEKYNQMEPYIYINQETKEKSRTIIIELNSATIDDLVQIKGIGQNTAEAIIKYRKKLGGFVSVEQLLEIKTISHEMYDLFKQSLNTDKSKIKTISLNFGEIEEFVGHPYLNYYQAKEIIKFRSINGPYLEKSQLIKNKILLEQSYKKIEPYLTLN
jgi:competence ComEA-like helix-hairpin-helix protein